MQDSIGDRMKGYEEQFRSFSVPRIPLIIRLDGRAFHSFTCGLERPFSQSFHNLMVATTKRLVSETDALLGYTQSDEISLLLYTHSHRSQLWFGGNIQKIVSISAALATAFFNANLKHHLPIKADTSLPLFDSRAFNISREDTPNYFLWREQDATRNSISMAAQAVFSHSQLQGISCSRMQDMLMERGINWNDYPSCQKRGTYIQRKLVNTTFSIEELSELPPKHAAHKNPHLVFERHRILELELPIFSKIVNKDSFIFDGVTAEIAVE